MRNQMKRLSDADLYSIYCRWRQGSGPFACYVRANNFVSLKHHPDLVLKALPRGKDLLWSHVSSIIDRRDLAACLLILDLPGADSMRIGCHLQQEKAIKPVLTFTTPLHPHGLIGGAEYISALLLCGESLEPVEPRGFAFILDHERFGPYSDEDLRKCYNNQYELIDEDLPPAEMIKELGFQQILYVHESGVKEDLAHYLEYLTAQGCAVTTEDIGGKKPHG
jgi:hypothetical protein